MNEFVADTMAIVLRLEKRRMSDPVKEIFKKAENAESEYIFRQLQLQKSVIYPAETGLKQTYMH